MKFCANPIFADGIGHVHSLVYLASHEGNLYVVNRQEGYNLAIERDCTMYTVKTGFGSPPKKRGKNRGDYKAYCSLRGKTKLFYHLYCLLLAWVL